MLTTSTYPNSGGAVRVQIYAPYVFLNKTGLPFDLAAKAWSGGQREVAGRADFAGESICGPLEDKLIRQRTTRMRSRHHSVSDPICSVWQ